MCTDMRAGESFVYQVIDLQKHWVSWEPPGNFCGQRSHELVKLVPVASADRHAAGSGDATADPLSLFQV